MKKHDICHVEIRTRDLAGAKRFWGAAFDWKLAEFMPGYAGIDTGASPGGGIFQTPSADIPLGVCNYVWVEDCESSARRVAELGGTVLVAKTAVADAGWFANTVDPWGNEVGLWQPADPSRAPNYQGSKKNGFCWVELSAPNLDAAIGYYTRLFGWKLQLETGMEYAFTEHAGGTIGVGLLGGEAAKHRSGALTYVDVEDLGVATARIEAAGGKKIFGPREIPNTGSFSIFADPEGNQMAIFKGLRKE